jgi:hypothetical protein
MSCHAKMSANNENNSRRGGSRCLSVNRKHVRRVWQRAESEAEPYDVHDSGTTLWYVIVNNSKATHYSLLQSGLAQWWRSRLVFKGVFGSVLDQNPSHADGHIIVVFLRPSWHMAKAVSFQILLNSSFIPLLDTILLYALEQKNWNLINIKIIILVVYFIYLYSHRR